MKLTEQQLSFFDTFGYLAFPGLMADCIDEIRLSRTFDEGHVRGAAGR